MNVCICIGGKDNPHAYHNCQGSVGRLVLSGIIKIEINLLKNHSKHLNFHVNFQNFTSYNRVHKNEINYFLQNSSFDIPSHIHYSTQ